MLRGLVRRIGAVGLAGAMGAGALAIGCGDLPGGDQAPSRRPAAVYAGRPAVPVVQLSLQSSARLYPSESSRLKEVRLDAMHGVVDLGPDGKFVGWSFGGQTPGPTVRVRVGDRVRFTVTNRTDEPIDGLSFDRASQSIEVGGLLIDHQDEHRSIRPGETLELELTAMAPGLHLYQGGLPTATDAVAAGMYGMVVIDPSDGFPSHADREYAIVQSELFARPDPAGRRLGNASVKIVDHEAITSKRPSHFGYGGHFAPLSGLRLGAEPGERVRLFVLNAGPFATARFQLQGLPFERVWPTAVMGDKPSALGPATLLPGTGAIVEFVVTKKGRYRFADQQLASRGLVGLIDAAQGEPVAAAALVIKPPRTISEKRQRAREIFVDRCVVCHEPVPGSMRMAPDLTDVLKRRDRKWLAAWLADPPKMQNEDPIAKELMQQWNNIPMPQMMLSADQIEWMLDYLSAPPGPKKS
jgi:nitrite reductase (NO-forming)